MVVYLPDDYGTSDERYPVLYLLHGARGHEDSWIEKGHVLQLTDSLVRSGDARRCIIVMPNVNQYRNDRDRRVSRVKRLVETVLGISGSVESSFVDDVVGYVDSNFRTIRSVEARAIIGLSVGGLQTRYITANNPGVFGQVGLFSPMFLLALKPGPSSSFYRHYGRKLQEQFSEVPLTYNYYVGKTDIVLRAHIAVLRKTMDRHAYPYDFILTGGGHTWDNWEQYYIDMLKGLF